MSKDFGPCASPRLWAVPPATDAGIATPAGVLLHASSHLGHQLVTAQAANRLVSTEQANALPSVVPRLMTLSPFETMASCMVPSAAWRIGSLCSSGSQREHRTYRFGHPTPEPQALLGILSLLLALGSAFPYFAARGAVRRSASPHVIREHLADLLGVQAQKLLVQGCSYVLPCLLELVRL